MIKGIPSIGESDSERSSGDVAVQMHSLPRAPTTADLDKFEKYLNKKLGGTPRPLSSNRSRPSKASTSSGSAPSLNIQIKVQSPSTSPQLSPWLGHIPTPRSQDWADRLVPPAHSVGTIQWKTLGFFEDRDCYWWIGFVTSMLIVVACILVLCSALFAPSTVEHIPESSEDSIDWLAEISRDPPVQLPRTVAGLPEIPRQEQQ